MPAKSGNKNKESMLTRTEQKLLEVFDETNKESKNNGDEEKRHEDLELPQFFDQDLAIKHPFMTHFQSSSARKMVFKKNQDGTYHVNFYKVGLKGQQYNDNNFKHIGKSNANTGRWTQKEHLLFLEGLKLFRNSWVQISQHIGTRTVT